MSLKRLVFVLALPVALLAPGARASAQLTPADSAAVLLGTAARFVREGRSDVADALYRYIAAHFGTTPAAADARARLQAAPAPGTTGGGRVELQVWSTLYGLWLGVAVPGALGVDGPEPYGVGLLLGGPAGFLAGKTIARSRDLSVGQARAITLGGTWGTWQGLGWTNVFDIGEGYRCDYPDLCTSDGATAERFAGMIVGGLAGIGVGALLSRREISPGAATTANFGALWGTWLGFAGGYLTDMEDDNLLAATLVGGDAGLLAAAALAPRWDMSRSRARLVSLYGVVGGLSGLGVDLLTQPDDDKVLVALPLAGSVLGLILGARITSDYDRAHVGGDAVDFAGTALLNLDGGVWSVGTPLPTPTRLRQDTPTGTRWTPAMTVPLLRAKFR